MGEINENAQLTISAASAEKCQDGFLATRLRYGDIASPCDCQEIPAACPNGESGSVSLRETTPYHTSLEPLNRRAWALQERFLSPRVLIYACSQMYWQCQSQEKCDGGSTERFVSNTARLSIPSLQIGLTSHEGGTTEEEKNALFAGWSSLVFDYTHRDLSDPSDKLPALSSNASKYQKATNDTYCAGLWKTSLLEGLKWQVNQRAIERASTTHQHGLRLPFYLE